MKMTIKVNVESAMRAIKAEEKYWMKNRHNFGTVMLREGKEIMRSECPEGETGELKASVQSDITDTPNGVRIAVWNDAWYYPIVDDDMGRRTQAHLIYSSLNKLLVFEIGGRLIATKHVHHPGSRTYPISKNTADRLVKLVEELARGYVHNAPK